MDSGTGLPGGWSRLAGSGSADTGQNLPGKQWYPSIFFCQSCHKAVFFGRRAGFWLPLTGKIPRILSLWSSCYPPWLRTGLCQSWFWIAIHCQDWLWIEKFQLRDAPVSTAPGGRRLRRGSCSCTFHLMPVHDHSKNNSEPSSRQPPEAFWFRLQQICYHNVTKARTMCPSDGAKKFFAPAKEQP